MRSTTRAAVLCTTMAALLVGGAIVAAPMRAEAQDKRTAQAWGGKTNAAGHYAAVNGIKLYYESHGTGKPRILLHGGLGAIEMFGPNLETLGKGRRLITTVIQFLEPAGK